MNLNHLPRAVIVGSERRPISGNFSVNENESARMEESKKDGNDG